MQTQNYINVGDCFPSQPHVGEFLIFFGAIFAVRKKVSVCGRVISWGEKLLADDITTNKSIGDHGAHHIEKTSYSINDRLKILTHCNTGSLATAGYGTALGKYFVSSSV